MKKGSNGSPGEFEKVYTAESKVAINIQVIHGIFTAVTVCATVVFERLVDQVLAIDGRRSMLELVGFDIGAGIEALQHILFSALADCGVFVPKKPHHVSWA